MRFAGIVAKINALAIERREAVEVLYGNLSEYPYFIGFFDLEKSSNYRLIEGAKKGYIRSETLAEIVRTVLEKYDDLSMVKELGDGYLVISKSIQELLEASIIIKKSAEQIAAIEKEKYPFSVRTAIGFGGIKKIVRPSDDYLGSAIDRTARLSSVKSNAIIISEEAYENGKNVLEEYGDIIEISLIPSILSDDISKNMVKSVYFREIVIRDERLMTSRDHFTRWEASAQ